MFGQRDEGITKFWGKFENNFFTHFYQKLVSIDAFYISETNKVKSNVPIISTGSCYSVARTTVVLYTMTFYWLPTVGIDLHSTLYF